MTTVIDKLIPKSRINEWLDELSAQYKVLVPVTQENGPPQYQVYSQGAQPLLANKQWVMSPKEELLPRYEPLFEYHRGEETPKLESLVPEPEPTLMFGLKACDVRSLQILDKVYLDGRFTDPYYASRRSVMLTVAYACEDKRWSCFCSSVGEPVEWLNSADLVLTDIGDEYVVTAGTPAGEGLLAGSMFIDASDDHAGQRQQVWENLSKPGLALPQTSDVAQAVDWDEPAWDAIAEKCLGCGICSYMCPTCTCFDIQDEQISLESVERYRVRDTCQFCDFTKMGHGHNPRPGRKERARQRVSHKFKYIVQQCGIGGCVGCGRCVELCPVNVDLRKVLADIAEKNERESLSA